MTEKKKQEKKKIKAGGRIQVYTGNGKGKTTAALGQALRAAGWGLRTYFGQFMKGQKYGELASAAKLDGLIVIEQFGKKSFIHVTENPSGQDIARARRGLASCREAMLSGLFRIVVLDEINTAVFFRLLPEAEVLDLMDSRPAGVELILTGRYAPRSFIRKADLVTEVKEIKHYYAQGVQARKGIER
ncbi:MAG: cob(I)yrinic acid a,c-diamide adenosyltransferase [Pseudomonadota bacterium]